MTRLAASLYWQVIYQHRNGFYVASVVTVAMLVGLLSALPANIDLATKQVAVAVFTIFAVQITTFFFVGGILLLERGEGVLSAFAVSPLPPGEYLFARVVTLSALATVETLVIGAAITGASLDVALFVAGAFGLSIIFSCFGFAFFARYTGLNEALLPSVLATIVLSLPAIALASPAPFVAWNLHPTHGAMQLVAVAFGMNQTFGAIETLSLAGWIVGVAALARAAARRLLAAADLQ